MSNMTILLFGPTGQIGWELRRTLAPLARVLPVGRDVADLAVAGQAGAAIERTAPSLVINAAAYTAVDRAEEEPGAAEAVNGMAVAEMARICAASGIPLVHYSTDYVFDGMSRTPYSEESSVGPLGVYGATKLHGEESIEEAGGPHLIFRTAWVYGQRGRNFLNTIRRLAREKEELTVVADQIGAPTWARAIAEGTAAVIVQLLRQDRVAWEAASGVYNLTAAGETSWHGFAEAIIDELRSSDPECRPPVVKPISAADYPTLAKRPAYSVLANGKIGDAFGVSLPDWREQLALAMDGE